MLAQTTDSGSNNFPAAREMSRMLAEAPEPATWDFEKNHVRCYCHKLACVVKAGLDYLKVPAGHIKPTKPSQPLPHVPIVPDIQLNDGAKELVMSESDDESGKFFYFVRFLLKLFTRSSPFLNFYSIQITQKTKQVKTDLCMGRMMKDLTSLILQLCLLRSTRLFSQFRSYKSSRPMLLRLQSIRYVLYRPKPFLFIVLTDLLDS
jgi:hypothetical protein